MIAFLHTLWQTCWDVLPIVLAIVGFQWLIIRRPIPHLGRTLVGFGYVIVGLALFLQGLDQALFPIGRLMAEQLTSPAFLPAGAAAGHWYAYAWVYVFAFMLGFSTAIAEPSLLAVALKANQISGGTITVWGLRIAAALGVGVGITVGVLRIVTGVPIAYALMACYTIVIVQTYYAPRVIIPLAYDSGGVTTSTVTVPLVAALGLGLAANVPGRSALVDGFGLIAFACLFPIMTVMGYAQIAHWRNRRAR